MLLARAARCTVDAATARRSTSPAAADVFSGASDFVYVPRDADGRDRQPPRAAASPCRRRACDAAAARSGYQPADAVPVELRGAGQASRQVNNFCTPGRLRGRPAHRLRGAHAGRQLVVVPAAQARRGDATTESELEEIYYFEVADGPARSRAWPTSVSTATPGKEIDVLAEVRSGDVVLIPHGWHGPSMAVPGYDLYYLNVMAGPGDERAWLICDDPAHSWVRDDLGRPGRRPAAAVRSARRRTDDAPG